MFNFISKDLNVDGNLYEILGKSFEYTNKHGQIIIENEYFSQFNDYRDNDAEEKTDDINKKFCMLPFHKELSNLDSNKTQMDYDANSLHPSAMREGNLVYPKRENGFVFKPDMNNVYVEALNNQTFNQDCDESAILRIKYYNPPNLIFQHLPVKEKVKKVEVNKMRNGYIIDTLTSVDFCEIIKIRGKVGEIYEGVICREIFKISPFRKVIENVFALRQK